MINNRDNYNKKNGKRSLKKRSVLLCGLIVLVMISTSFAVVSDEHGGPGGSSAAGIWGNGNGTQGEPYLISDADGLKQLADDVDGGNEYEDTYFRLTNDIDLSEFDAGGGTGWMPIGNGFGLIKETDFQGYFDGCGYEILNMTINRPSTNFESLFGDLGEYGTVCNLGVVNVDVTGYFYSSSIVGFCYGTVSNCYATGTVNGYESAAGLIGMTGPTGVVDSCYNACDVSEAGTDGGYIGGIVGENNGTIMNCYNTGTVSGWDAIGGVASVNYGSIENCYNTGTISGHFGPAGIVCNTNDIDDLGKVVNCYNTGAVSGFSGVGGIISSISLNDPNSELLENCFFLKEEGGINDGVYGIGNTETYDNATPLDSAEMQKQDNFTLAGWDFSSSGPWGMFPKGSGLGTPCYGLPYLKTINNFILITPNGGSKVFDGKPAPEPPGWIPAPSTNISTIHPLSATLTYDTPSPVDVGSYGIAISGQADSTFYQLRFCDDVLYYITAPSASSKDYTITATSDSNSAITPPGQVTVQSGGSMTFTYSAANGYHISSVIVNGTALDQDQITGTYTFTNVLYNQTIDVKSASGPGSGGSGTKTSITLTVDIVGGKGTAEYRIGSGQYITFTGPQSIPVGSNLYVSVEADSGYSFVDWTGEVNSSDKELNFAGVDHDINLTAHLSKDNSTGGFGHSGSFAILNLILAILALLIGIIAIVAGTRRKDDEKKATGTAVIAGVLALIFGIVSIIVFFVTEDMSAPMITTDSWTVWMAVLFVVTVVLAVISFWASRGQKAKD